MAMLLSVRENISTPHDIRCCIRANGELGLGNGKGEVILFEPSTSEHISARTIFDPITALAPAMDCRTYAIGYVQLCN